jgi:hypothetical protein
MKSRAIPTCINSYTNKHQTSLDATLKMLSQISKLPAVCGPLHIVHLDFRSQKQLRGHSISSRIWDSSTIVRYFRSNGGFESYGKGVPSIVRSPSGRKIREFPMSSTAILGRSLVFGGGGYFRLIPGWIGRALFRRADYNMTYFHLRDFDTDQPMVPGLSLVRRFKSYVGISGAAMKLDRMLNNFEMITLSEAAARIEWDNVQIFCCDGTLMRQSAEIGRNEP